MQDREPQLRRSEQNHTPSPYQSYRNQQINIDDYQ